MRFLLDVITETVHALRLVTASQWLLRVLCGASLIGAGLLCLSWFPMLTQELLIGVIIGAALWSIARPESWAPLVGISTVALWWLVAAASAPWWQTTAVAGLLGLFHLLVAACAAAPSYAAVEGRALTSMLRGGLGYLAACAGAVALVFAVSNLVADRLPFGLAWIALALASIVTATALVLMRLRNGSSSSS